MTATMASVANMIREKLWRGSKTEDDAIITTITPVHIGLIKFFEHPSINTLYTVHDYLVMTLDLGIIGSKTSACARAEFTEDEFWFNGKKCTTQFAFCLNEVKYRAATQRSVSIEFLKRKVHLACDNTFLPSVGSSAFAAGFTSVMAALCQLYRVKPENVEVENHAPFPDLNNFVGGGFVQKREIIATKKHFKEKLIAGGKDWPELRVLILIVEDIHLKGRTVDNLGTDRAGGRNEHILTHEYLTVSNEMYRYYQQYVPANFKKLVAAIKEKDFETFANTIMEDNDHFHNVNVDAFHMTDYKTSASYLFEKYVKIFNGFYKETRVGYSFETGPNPTLYFLEKDAQEIISFVKYIFPTTNPALILGLEDPPYLGDKYFAKFSLDPVEPDYWLYGIYTKVGDECVKFLTDKEDHILDESGKLILPEAEISTPIEEDVQFSQSHNVHTDGPESNTSTHTSVTGETEATLKE